MSGKDSRHHRERDRKKAGGRDRGDLLFGLVLFVIVVFIMLGSVLYVLAPAGQRGQSQQQTTVNPNTLPGDDPTLFTCIQPDNIVMRLKVNLRIIINNQQFKIPAKIGESTDCIRPLHTKDVSGDIYVESPIRYQYAVRDFFAVWKQAFDKDHIFFYRATETHKIIMTVNGQQNFDYEKHVLADGEQIVITYT